MIPGTESGIEISKLHRLAGRYDNPVPTWFLAPKAGFKLPTQAGGIDSLESIHGLLKSLKIRALFSIYSLSAACIPHERNFVSFFTQAVTDGSLANHFGRSSYIYSMEE